MLKINPAYERGKNSNNPVYNIKIFYLCLNRVTFLTISNTKTITLQQL